jgi:hypothetical protein
MTAGTNDEHVIFDAQELHRRAHATVASYGEDGMWLEPMETALVALADAEHPRGSRGMATTALDGFMKWLTRNDPRALGDDAAALAIAARAARDLQRGSAQLTAQAAELVTAACERHKQLAPLHVALAAWALDPLVSDRGAQPWEAIRNALHGFTRQGLNEALVLFATALADQQRSAVEPGLAQIEVIGLTEQCILLWLLTAAVAVQTERGFTAADELSPFSTRRAEVLEQLAIALTGAEESAPVHEFDPFGQPGDDFDGLYLFEALMLDLALSGEGTSRSFITLEEADRRAMVQGSRLQLIYAGVCATATLIAAGAAAAIGILAKADTHLWVGSAFTVAMVGLAVSVLFLNRARTRWPLDLLLTGVLLEIVLGLALIVEGVRGKTFFGDDVATLLGLACLGGPFIAQAVATRMLKK